MKVVGFSQLKPIYGIPYTRDHLRRKVKAGEFPPPIQLSERMIAWREEDVEEWIRSRPVQAVASRGIVG